MKKGEKRKRGGTERIRRASLDVFVCVRPFFASFLLPLLSSFFSPLFFYYYHNLPSSFIDFFGQTKLAVFCERKNTTPFFCRWISTLLNVRIRPHPFLCHSPSFFLSFNGTKKKIYSLFKIHWDPIVRNNPIFVVYLFGGFCVSNRILSLHLFFGGLRKAT